MYADSHSSSSCSNKQRHKVPHTEVYDTNDCIDKEMARKDTNDINNERKEKKEFELEIDLDYQDKE